jgi:hypothetical protein
MKMEAHKSFDAKHACFLRRPSRTVACPNRNPKQAVEEKQKHKPHDLREVTENVPTPPKSILIDIITNSAKNISPPELPISFTEIDCDIRIKLNKNGMTRTELTWPARQLKMTIVTKL